MGVFRGSIFFVSWHTPIHGDAVGAPAIQVDRHDCPPSVGGVTISRRSCRIAVDRGPGLWRVVPCRRLDHRSGRLPPDFTCARRKSRIRQGFFGHVRARRRLQKTGAGAAAYNAAARSYRYGRVHWEMVTGDPNKADASWRAPSCEKVDSFRTSSQERNAATEGSRKQAAVGRAGPIRIPQPPSVRMAMNPLSSVRSSPANTG